MKTQIFKVEGMACKNCKLQVETSINTLDGVQEVHADIVTGQIRVLSEGLDESLVKAKIEDAGFDFGGELRHSGPGSDVWIS